MGVLRADVPSLKSFYDRFPGRPYGLNSRPPQRALANGVTQPTRLANQALANSNKNPGCNTYLWQDPAWTRAEAARVEAMPLSEGGAFGDGRDALWGLPISVKDCFDLAGAPTSCGVQFYRDLNGKAARDSWLVDRLRAAGAVITGKTHLHPLAYGITGENPEFGDCLQPGDTGALTGGSSSGACASVLEGSAVAAIGTDYRRLAFASPRRCAALPGYRASLGRGDWLGAAHLARSFDTMGWLFQDLEEAPLFGSFSWLPASRRTYPHTTGSPLSMTASCTTAEPEVAASYATSSATCKLSACTPPQSRCRLVVRFVGYLPASSRRGKRPEFEGQF